MDQINFSSSNISMRPANPNDSIFIEELFRSPFHLQCISPGLCGGIGAAAIRIDDLVSACE